MKKKKANRRKNKRQGAPPQLWWGLLLAVVVAYLLIFFKIVPNPLVYLAKFTYSETDYPQATVRGIDISHYQRDIDWNKVAHATIQGDEISFVFIKATEGSDTFDPNFNYNFYQARRQGIIRGAYHFFSIKSSARAQANFFCHTVGLEPGDLPPVLDIETSVDKVSDYSREKLRNEVITWLNIVQQYYGVRPIIYCSSSFISTYLSDPYFANYPLWIAHYYVRELTFEGKWQFWQHADNGHIDGIPGKVDINIFNGSKEDLEALLIK